MRVALYARVSTEEQARHGISIEAQTEALRKWAVEQGHEIIGEYVDNGVSARKSPSKRPALQQLLQDTPEQKIELIAFTKLDRWTRNVRGYYQVQEILDKHHVAWNAILERYETQTANGRFTVNVLLAVSEQEADRTAERIKTVFEHKIAKGEAITQSLPLGLTIENKRVVPDDNADIVRDVFYQFITTANAQRTRDYLRLNYGIAMPSHSMSRLLRNELYIGRYKGNTDYCQPIIDEATFAEAQRIIAMHGVKQSPSHRVYLFSGLIYCAECGHRMTGFKSRVQSYRCNTHYALKQCRHNGCYREQQIEDYLLENIGELVKGQAAKFNTSARKTKKVDVSAVKKKLERLKELYIDGDISKDKYCSERDKLNLLLDTPKPPKSSSFIVLGDSFISEYRNMSQEQKQQFWRMTIDKITIDSQRNMDIFLR